MSELTILSNGCRTVSTFGGIVLIFECNQRRNANDSPFILWASLSIRLARRGSVTRCMRKHFISAKYSSASLRERTKRQNIADNETCHRQETNLVPLSPMNRLKFPGRGQSPIVSFLGVPSQSAISIFESSQMTHFSFFSAIARDECRLDLQGKTLTFTLIHRASR